MSVRFTVKFDRLDEMLKTEAAKVALDLFSDIQIATPVDTGALRNAWEVDTDLPSPIITNTEPYANRVMNGGHSKQAPTGTLDNIIDKYRN